MVTSCKSPHGGGEPPMDRTFMCLSGSDIIDITANTLEFRSPSAPSSLIALDFFGKKIFLEVFHHLCQAWRESFGGKEKKTELKLLQLFLTDEMLENTHAHPPSHLLTFLKRRKKNTDLFLHLR